MTTPANSNPVPVAPRTSWHVALLGGLRRDGSWRMPARYVSVSVIGGVELDLREAELAAPEVTLTKVSLVGGVHVIVPPTVRVEVQSVTVIGRRSIDVPDGPTDGPLVRIRSFGLFGGVKVRAS